MVYEYDPASDSWTKKKPMPIPTHHQSMVAYGGKIYMFGGFTLPTAQGAAGGGGAWVPIDNAWEYDPATDTWRALAPLPGKRGSAVAAEVGGKMYVLGGATTYPTSKDVGIGGNGAAMVLTTNQMYDPATNTWANRSPHRRTDRARVHHIRHQDRRRRRIRPRDGYVWCPQGKNANAAQGWRTGNLQQQELRGWW